jgi:hypothetical protein
MSITALCLCDCSHRKCAGQRHCSVHFFRHSLLTVAVDLQVWQLQVRSAAGWSCYHSI